MTKIKVEGYASLVRDTQTGAIINTDKSSYNVYMQRVLKRKKEGDTLRSAVKEINTLKAELREIKQLIIGLKK
jgi:hypothetical protein